MIKREHYLSKIRPFYESDLIKVITGIRRCGKSIILNQIKEEISTYSDNIIELNFEDRKTQLLIKDSLGLINYVEDNLKREKVYIFLDEIQNLCNWDDAVKTIRLKNASIFITGSNSKLLSREFTKNLSGRYVSFQVRPFIYKEIKEYCLELHKECSVTDYLVWGGFPKRFEFDSIDAQKQYLEDLNQTIIYNDLISRYKIRKIEIFTIIRDYILRSNSRIYSVNSIQRYLINNNIGCSINTVIKYLSYLEEAYIIESINQYSTKAKKDLAFYKKIYNSDVSFNSIRCIDNRYDLTHSLENIVYNELLFRGYNVRVYDNDGKQIDFIALKDNKTYLIQVCYSLEQESTYIREFSAFKNIDNLVSKIVISNDELDYSTSIVKHIRLKDFLESDVL